MPRAVPILLLALLALLLPLPAGPGSGDGGGLAGAAWADDDDDGGDDDDDDDGDDDDDDAGGGGFGGGASDDDDDDDGPRFGGGGGGFLQDLLGRNPRPVPAAPQPPAPRAAPDEILSLALTDDDLAALLAQGFTLIEERDLGTLGAVQRRMRIPPDLSLEEARDRVRAVPSGGDADFNHFYRSEQGFPENCRGLECPARLIIDWPASDARLEACGRGATIGMIDTGINRDHETFADAALEVVRVGDPAQDASGALHGTAVAALLVGDPSTRAPGLVPGAHLIAVDAFHRAGGDERADLFTLLEGLDLLAEAGVSVINLSLAGPPNTVLEAAVARIVEEQDIVLVAAVGNDGPAADPAYPAAYPSVIAVTAVDRDGQVYRRAVVGPHVDLAAPGVDVWTAASISGARTKTGTSYAVPFVTAAAAILRQARPDLSAIDVGIELRDLARDVGDPGPDSVYGAGLLQVPPLC